LQGGYPRFNITSWTALGNPNVSNPFLFRDNQYVATGNLSWVKGTHTFRFGAEYAYYTINHFQPQASNGPRGGFNFTGGLTALRGGAAPNLYNAWGDWLLGQAQSLGKDVQYVNPAAVRMPSVGFYARDQWQVNRKLTLNFGVRLERYPFGTRDHRGFERYDADLDTVLVGGVGSTPKTPASPFPRSRWRRASASLIVRRKRRSYASATASRSTLIRSAACATPIRRLSLRSSPAPRPSTPREPCARASRSFRDPI
jgi:outer membrane receptor protein involved in Fe transport